MKIVGKASDRGSKEVHWYCPECQRAVAPPTPEAPHCPNCRENLYRCRYCQWADQRVWECTNPHAIDLWGDEFGRFRIPEPEHYFHCPFYNTSLDKPGRFLTSTRAWLGIGLPMLVMVVALGSVLWSYLKPQFAPSLMHRSNVPSSVELGKPFPVRITLQNQDREETGNLLLRLEGELVEKVKVVAVNPAPTRQEQTPKAVHLYYPTIKGGKQLEVRLYFRAVERGRFKFRILPYYRNYVATGPRRSYQVEVE